MQLKHPGVHAVASVVSNSLRPLARQAPLSTGFSKQEYWSGLPFPSPGNLPSPGIEPTSLTSPTLAGGASLPLAPPSGKPSNKLFATEQETEFGSEKGVLGQ